VTERFILCMKYGSAYPADYVNVLYNATRKALKRPARFVCLTDDATGLFPDIEVLPIPDLGLAAQDWFRPGVWPKVSLFDGAFHGLRGRALFIDLDMVVVNDLDAFFDYPGSVIGTNASPSWGKPEQAGEAPEFGSMIFAFDIGAHPHLADDFRADPAAIWNRFRQEQQYVHHALPEATFWPQGWVASFKRSLRQPIGLDLVMGPRKPGGQTKVLAFHGRPRPIDLIRGKPFFWDRFPHMGHGQVPWMADYWTANGGRI
jgi:hypothetical protein